MTTYQFGNVVQRQVEDGRDITFDWPTSGLTFTYTFSVDGGVTFTPGINTITENPDDGGLAEYQIPYDEAERPGGVGTVIYHLTDSEENDAKLPVNIKEVVIEYGTGDIKFTVTVQGDNLDLIVGAKVSVYREDGSDLGFSDTTDENGAAFFLLDAGKYQFLVSNVRGYETAPPTMFDVSEENTSGLIVLTSITDYDPSALDLSGIKRVRTKHMEIEAFDPRIVQQAAEKENGEWPTFCNIPMCKAVPKRCR